MSPASPFPFGTAEFDARAWLRAVGESHDLTDAQLCDVAARVLEQMRAEAKIAEAA